ncbi:hypothetical protein [Ottowia sp.]|uniref:hypothetical protein n=1 Tax=Ottowia sp. TaxID=1898956 RepID=UPI0039E704BF
MKQTATFALALLAAAGAQAACYTVLGPKGQVLSESPTPPVDMSYQLHQTVPYKYGPGATMVFGIADGNCGEPADAYYDINALTPVVHGDGRRRPLRKARRDRG